MLLIEEILHHLGCNYKPLETTGYLPYQLVQDFFHQPYHQEKKTILEKENIIMAGQPTPP